MATVREQLAQAAAEHAAGRPAGAVALCREILAADPAQADAWHLLGIARHALGEPDAVDDLRRAIALQPDSAVFHHNLASVLAAHGELAAACAAYGDALVRAPNDPDSACALAEVCAAMQDWPAAIAAWRQALAGGCALRARPSRHRSCAGSERGGRGRRHVLRRGDRRRSALCRCPRQSRCLATRTRPA